MKPARTATPTVFAGLLVGLATMLLVYGQIAGIGTSVMFVSFLVGLLGLAAYFRSRPNPANLWLIAPYLFFAAFLCLRTNSTLTVMNLLAATGLGILIVWGFLRSSILRFTLLDGLVVNLAAIMQALIGPIMTFVASARELEDQRNRRWLVPAIRGTLIALPFLLIFTLLFASADLVFGGLIKDFFEQFNIDELIGRSIVTVVFAWIAIGALAFALSGTAVADDGTRQTPLASAGMPPSTSGISLRWLGFIEGAVFLGLIDLLFGAFVFVQIRYFFLAAEDFAVRNISYANYAREGFFQLVVAALLTLFLVWLLDLVVRREGRQVVAFNVLMTITIGCTLVMLVSAFRRLYLYELEYGFTEDRVFSHSFTVLIGVIFVLFLAALLTNHRSILAFGLVLSLIAYIGILDLGNPEAFIASANIQRYRDGKPLDVNYLGRLSEDSVATLIAEQPSLPANIRSQFRTGFDQRRDRLANYEKKYGWQSAHLARDQALNLLIAYSR